MKKRLLTLIGLLLWTAPGLFAQPTISCPNVDAGSDVNLGCVGCSQLDADWLAGNETTDYTVGSIPYNPYPFANGTGILLNIDDTWSSPLPVGFDFCFYDNTYNQLVIGSNGLITFDLTQAGGYCQWPINNPIPSNANPMNSIMGPFHDIDPSITGTIRWAQYGQAPCRVFVVTFDQVAMYSGTCNSQLATQQIAIYETTNIIEVYIQSKPLCSSWNSGTAILGIQNANGTQATVVPGRNHPTQWTANNEGWRFVPDGAPNTTVAWYELGGASPIATTDTVTVCPPGPTNSYVAEVTYTNCNNAQVVVRDTVTVTLNPANIISNPTVVDNFCPDDSIGSISLSPSGGNPAYTFVWSTGSTSNSISNLPVGSYSVTITDADSCQMDTVINIGFLTNISTSIVGTDPGCAGFSNGSATASPSGGTAPYTFQWSPTGGTNPTATGLPAGTFTVVVTDANGCMDTASITLGEPAPLALTLSSTPVSCAGADDGTATVSISGGTPGYSPIWSTTPLQTTLTATNLPPGNYLILVIDNNGCQDTSSVSVIGPDPLQVLIAGSQDVSCNGGSDGYALSNVTGGNPPYTYNWNTTPVQSSDSAGGLSAGTYLLTVTDSSGCSDSASVTISQPSPVVVVDSVTNVSCNGATDGCAYLSVSGGNGNYHYLWGSGDTLDSICGLAPGTYGVTVTDTTYFVPSLQMIWLEDFEGISNWTLNDPTGPNGVDFNRWVINDNEGGVLPPGCGIASNGDSTLHITSVFNPNGGAAYDAGGLCGTLFCPETNQRAISPPINTVGFNNLTLSFDFISNGDGLLDNASVQYNDGSGWVTLLGTFKSNLCLSGQGQWTNFSGTLPASAANIPNLQIAFNWTNNDDGIGTDPSVAINNVRILSLVGSNGFSLCTSIDSVTIVEPAPLGIAFNVQDILCAGDSSGCIVATPSGGNGNYSYLWSTGDTLDSICGLGPGTYYLTLTDTSSVAGGGSSSIVNLYGEDFQGPTQSWTLNIPTGPNGVDFNRWEIDDDEGGVPPPGCGVANNGDLSLHITSVFCPTCGAAYDAGGLCGLLFCPESNQRAESPAFSTVGASNISLSFDFISNGDGLLDNASVVYNDGSGWQTLVPSIKSNVCVTGQGEWTAFSIPLPASAANIPNLQVGFNWTNNDDGVGSDPSVAINNVEVTGTITTGGTGSTVLCSHVDSVVISEPSPLVLAISGTDVSCFGAHDGTAAVTISGGTPGYAVLWNTTQTDSSLTGLGSGTYSVVVTDTNGCFDSDSISLNEPPQILTTTTAVDLLCNGDANGCAAVNATGGIGPFTYLWSNGAVIDSVCGLSGGTYIVTVTDTAQGGNCQVLDTVIVAEPSPLQLNLSATTATCSAANGSASASVSGGTPGYTYAWNSNPAQASQTATALSSGTYTVTVTDLNGCQVVDSIFVPNATGPSISMVNTNDVSCAGGNDGNATVVYSGGSPVVNVIWNTVPTQSGNTATGLGAGSYTVYTIDANGCSDSLAFTISEPTLLTSSITSTLAACGQNTASATVVPAGGTPGYSYTWSTSPTQTTPTATNLGPGTYSVTVTDAQGCSSTANTTVLGSPNPVANVLSSINVDCGGASTGSAVGSVSSGTAPFTYNWNSVPPQTSSTASNLPAGTYVFTVTDQFGCQDTAMVTITEPSPMVVDSALATNVGCNAVTGDGNGAVLVSGGVLPYSYNWSTIPPQTTLQAVNLDVGVYQVTVTDANGCLLVDSIEVERNPSPVVVAGPDVTFCEGEGGAQIFAIGSGGTPGYYYEWWCDSTNTYCGLDSVFDNDPIANPDTTTMYFVQVTDTNGCLSNVDSLLVTELPKPIVDAGPDIFLCGDNAPCEVLNPTISGAAGPYDYLWSPGAGLNDSTILNPCARPDTTTIYTLVVTAGNGCTSEATTTDTLSSITVHVNPIPVAEAGPDIDLCLGDTTALQAFASGAGPQYQFEWSPSTGLSDSTSASPLASPIITTTYTLVVWSNGCPSYADSVTVNVHTIPTVEAGWEREICWGDSTILDAQAYGDLGATYTFSWTPNDGIGGSGVGQEDPMTSPDSTTTYQVVAISSWGCESEPDNATVYLLPSPIAEADSNQTICLGDTLQLQGSHSYTTASGVQNQVYYSWNPSSEMDDSTLVTPLAWPQQSGYFYLDVRQGTCSTRDSVFVTVMPGVSPMAWADTSVICQYDSIRLFSTGGGLGDEQYLWTPSAGLSDPLSPNPMASPDSSTTYHLLVEEGGCFDSVEISVDVIPGPISAYASSLPMGCAPHMVSFLSLSDNASNWIWDFGDGSPVWNEPAAEHEYAAPGTYNVALTVVNSRGCANTVDTLEIVVGEEPVAAFGTNPSFPAELTMPATTVDFIDQSVGAVSWTWDFGDGNQGIGVNPNHTYTQPGTYMVELSVANALGCIARTIQGPFVVVSPELFIPNVFTPNLDGIGDEFRIEYSGNQPFEMTVYDRWGVMLYTNRNKTMGWNGKLPDNGDVAPEGTYFYLVRTGDREFTGSFTLVR